ncbi:DUF1911 domain-containing protein [Aquabacterium sp. A7-Y]|uniref:PoNe immunity protein domain-containing protein n=1 Tax=Aquabacterium sp. A7-Y TaxID=1349605 RepID=UPI00223E08C7|nr:PoNe immunity protein domain-containing protein [Aquabacterium sp. A7-Y]MCW7540698.1 DUF1911 domain-containing protein [Aquabacterium sp. A7-Y]
MQEYIARDTWGKDPRTWHRFFSEENLQAILREDGYPDSIRSLVLVAYSAGRPLDEIASYVEALLRRTVETNRKNIASGFNRYVGGDGYQAAGVYQDHYLWTLGLGVLFRVPPPLIEALLQELVHTDALLDAIATGAFPNRPIVRRQFHLEPWKELYEAVEAEPVRRPLLVEGYLQVWYAKRMRGMFWKNSHVRGAYVGYWCIEAAALSAALNIDDSSFRKHPHYPRDMVSYYRSHPAA